MRNFQSELIRAEHTPGRHPEQDPGQRLPETGTEVMDRGADSVDLGSTRQHARLSSHSCHRLPPRWGQCWPENPITSAWKPWAQPPREQQLQEGSPIRAHLPCTESRGEPLPRAHLGAQLVSVSQSQGSVKVEWFLPCHQLSSTDKLWP